MNTPIIGLIAGTAAGAAIGVGWEQATHTPKVGTKPEGFDAWEADFRHHFQEELATDATTDTQFASEVEAWTKAHPAPEGMTAGRTESSLSLAFDAPPQRDHSAALSFLTVGGIVPSMVALFAFERTGIDRVSFYGVRGLASTLPVALTTATVGAFIISNGTH